MQESPSRYSLVSILLHWLIAALLVANVFVSRWMYHAPEGGWIERYQVHREIGILVLVLSLVRLGWRLAHRWPPLPAGTFRLQAIAARGTHVLFYGLMIGIPVTGWICISYAHVAAAPLWGVVPWPDLPLPLNYDLSGLFGKIHHWLVYFGYGLVALHVAAALKHQFMDRDGVLARMLPLLPPAK